MRNTPPLIGLDPPRGPLTGRNLLQWGAVTVGLATALAIVAISGSDQPLHSYRGTVTEPSRGLKAVVNDVSFPRRHLVSTQVAIVLPSQAPVAAQLRSSRVFEVSYSRTPAWRELPVAVSVRWDGPNLLVISYDRRAHAGIRLDRWHSVRILYNPLTPSGRGA